MSTLAIRRLAAVAVLALTGSATALPLPARAQDVLGETGVRGAGSTFVYPVLSRWSQEYRDWLSRGGEFPAPNSGLEDPIPGLALSYEAVGSLAGTLRVQERAVDFGASDMPLASKELAELGLGQFPIVIGGVAVAVNIDGMGAGDVRLTGPVLAQIYLGTIHRWSDPSIRALNPALNLPDAAISVIHRSDGSGTTFNFTEYLSKVSPRWKLQAGSGLLIAWPTGAGAKSNEGVAKAVKATKNSIGYVDYAQATQLKLRQALIQNRAGSFVRPGTTSFQAAAVSVDWGKASDFNVLLLDPPGSGAYPITATVFALLHKQASQARTAATLDFFRWSLAHGSATAARLGYVPLPSALVKEVAKYWKTTFSSTPTGT